MTEAWAICEDDQIDVRTVSPTRQAAMINWLVVKRGIVVLSSHTEGDILNLWDVNRGDARVAEVRVELATPPGAGTSEE